MMNICANDPLQNAMDQKGVQYIVKISAAKFCAMQFLKDVQCIHNDSVKNKSFTGSSGNSKLSSIKGTVAKQCQCLHSTLFTRLD